MDVSVDAKSAQRQSHSKPNKAGFARAESEMTCQSIFPEN
jgi:hypothetical protein